MQIFKWLCLFICLTCNPIVIASSTSDPIAMLESVSNKLLVALKKERPRVRDSYEWVYRLVDKIVLPHVDVMGMSRSVLGRNAWLKATPSQRNAFNKEFTRVVVKTYASALDAYTDETIRFFPIRGGFEGYKRIFVKSEIIRRDGPPIPLDYKLILINNDWKIYDLHVEGVSLLQSFYSQFSVELSKGKTIDQLINDLRRRNLEKTS